MAKNNNEPELDLPTIAAGAEDDVFLDFSDVEEATGFEPLPAGVYPMVITGWKELVISKLGGKLPVGTKGTQIEFTVMDGHQYSGRKVWNTYWHAKSQLPYLKGMLRCSGQFTDEQLTGMNYDIMRAGIVGGQLLVRLTIKPGNDTYGPSNNVAKLMPFDDAEAQLSAANSDLPG